MLAQAIVVINVGAQVSAEAPKVMISPESTVWRFCDQPTTLFSESEWEAWRRPEFDDSGWQQGKGIMGYGDADVQTQLSYGADPQRKSIVACFRSRFNLAVSDRQQRMFGGRLCCDDGAVVWVNAQEVYRHNLPSGAISLRTFASSPVGPKMSKERAWHPFLIPVSVLCDGQNVVSVSVHQATSTSSDLAMSLELFVTSDASYVAAFRETVNAATDAQTQLGTEDVRIRPVARLK